MGLRIRTNIMSVNARRNLSRATSALQRNFEHLSTGKRIARGSDDAAGLAISSRLRKEVRSLDQAARNANDGISLVQTADGALSEIGDILIRMRELSIQSSNGTNSTADQDTLQQEFAELQASIDQIANTTSFNGVDLLNSVGNVSLQIGSNTTSNDSLSVDFSNVTGGAAGLNVAALDISSIGDTSLAISTLDTAINTVSDARAGFGASQNRLEVVISNLQNRSENLSAANSRIEDVDVAHETAMLTKNTILQQAAISVLAQANLQPQSALSLLQ